jgi:hypothetical protein
MNSLKTPSVLTRIVLTELRIKTDGTIHMCASKFFLSALRTFSQSRADAPCRVGAFEFFEQRTGLYVGVPDMDVDNATLTACADSIMAFYRSRLLFEAVFNAPGSYNSWVIFNRCRPTNRDLQRIAREQNIYIPFMSVPYKAPKVDIEALLMKAVEHTAAAAAKKPKVTIHNHVRPASPEKLQALAAAFSHRAV